MVIVMLSSYELIIVASVCVFVFFCFKQNTSYEMRISDWSSDVCSSDLLPAETMVRKVRASSVSMGLSRSRPFISILSISTADFPRLSNVWTLPSFKSGKMEDDHYGRDSLSQADAASGRDAARGVGRAAGRERVGKYGWISGGSVYQKKKKN